MSANNSPAKEVKEDAKMKEDVSGAKKTLGKRKRDHKNQKRKLRRIMNPDSNFIRDNEAQVISIQSGKDQAMEGDEVQTKMKPSEKKVIAKLLNQIEFYLGDANLAKDHYLQKKLEHSTHLDVSTFLDFNRIKGILEAGGFTDKSEQLKLTQEALNSSKMLKLSRDKSQVKRRVPFKADKIDQLELDKSMIYVENFPAGLSHDQLAQIFRRAGQIKHVSIPKYKESKISKGFAFIQYQSPQEAQLAVDLMNNKILDEFINTMNENFIQVQGHIGAIRVLLKIDWLKAKEEMRSIKTEIARLNPQSMFQHIKVGEPGKSGVKRYGFDSENGSIVRIKNLTQSLAQNITKHLAQDAIRHIAQPVFVELSRKTPAQGGTSVNVRFSDKNQAEIFVEKVSQLDSHSSPIHLCLGDKIQVSVLTDKDHLSYLQQASRDREEYHEYVKRVKKYKNLNKKQRKNWQLKSPHKRTSKSGLTQPTGVSKSPSKQSKK